MILKRIHHSYLLTRILVTIGLLMFYGTSSYSQKMSVESFQLDETDLTANQLGTIVLDQNGEKCALIKIETTHKGFSFDTGSLGIAKVEEQCSLHPGEIWLYVPHGCKKLTIQHGMFGTIKNYDLRVSVKKGKTYVMKLTTDHVNTIVLDYNSSQYLALKVFPVNAQVLINGVMHNTSSNGTLEIPMAFGTHNYRISAPNYHTAEGSFVINDKENKQNLSISLKQAFGYVDIKSPSNNDFDGADIYIDSIYVGKMPIKEYPLASGMHVIKVYKPLYKPYTETFAVSDSSSTTIMPTFAKNYAEVTVTTTEKAQIYDKDSLLGTGKWQGKLEAGHHTLIVKMSGHAPITKEVMLANGQETKIDMGEPVPVYGSLEITTVPDNAIIYIDGKIYNKSPLSIPNILIGKHVVEVRKEGYKTEIEDIEISEGQTYTIKKNLTDYCNATINSNTKAKVYIDNIHIGATPCSINKTAGVYLVELKSDGFLPYSKKMKLDGSTKEIYIKLRHNYVKKYEFYFNVGYNPINLKSWTIGLGGYIYNINAEFNYLGNTSSSETIYVSDGDIIPVPFNYSPSGLNLKTGYGFRCSSRIRITPQIGIQYIQLKEKKGNITLDDIYNPNYTDLEYTGFADESFAISATFGARISCAIFRHLGISINPEYSIPIKKSKGYKVLSDVSSDIMSYSKGFNCYLNVNCFF